MNDREKVKGIKELEVSYIHKHPECSDRMHTFEPVEEASISFGISWLEFKLADTGTIIHIPAQNIFEVWESDFYQQKINDKNDPGEDNCDPEGVN